MRDGQHMITVGHMVDTMAARPNPSAACRFGVAGSADPDRVLHAQMDLLCQILRRRIAAAASA